jgi:predicted RecA/RadA family phage recombinase
MLNEVYQDRPGNARFVVCPSTVLAGDAVLIGAQPAVAVDSYNAANGGTTFRFTGTYKLTFIAATVVSPVTGSAALPGDKVYATGTLDATTGVTTGLTLSKASGGTLFGSFAGTSQTSATTDTAALIKLKESV